MPRLPGRKSTAKTIPLERAVISSFAMPWEGKVVKRTCCIEDCDHKCSGRTDGKTTFEPFEPCSRSNVGFVLDKELMEAGDDWPFVGICCPHCTDRILDLGA